MNFRERRLTSDLKHFSETLKDLSEEFLVIQDFIKYEFGSQLAAFMSIRTKTTSLSKSGLSSPRVKGDRKRKGVSNTMKRKAQRKVLGKQIKRSKDVDGENDEPAVYNALSDEDDDSHDDEENSDTCDESLLNHGEDLDEYLEQSIIDKRPENDRNYTDATFTDDQQTESSYTANIAIKVEPGENENTDIVDLSDLPSPNSGVVRPRKAYTASFKLEMIQKAEVIGNRPTARQFDVSESMIRKWRKNKESLIESPTAQKSKRKRLCKWAGLERELRQWIIERRDEKSKVSGVMIIQHAKDIALRDGIVEFKGSSGWLENFMKRANVVLTKKKKCSKSDPVEGLIMNPELESGSAIEDLQRPSLQGGMLEIYDNLLWP